LKKSGDGYRYSVEKMFAPTTKVFYGKSELCAGRHVELWRKVRRQQQVRSPRPSNRRHYRVALATFAFAAVDEDLLILGSLQMIDWGGAVFLALLLINKLFIRSCGHLVASYRIWHTTVLSNVIQFGRIGLCCDDF